MKDIQPISPLAEPLKQAIVESGLPLLTLEQRTGVLRANIMRFVRGETSMRLDNADKLAAYLGLSLQPTQPTKQAATPKPKGK